MCLNIVAAVGDEHGIIGGADHPPRRTGESADPTHVPNIANEKPVDVVYPLLNSVEMIHGSNNLGKEPLDRINGEQVAVATESDDLAHADWGNHGVPPELFAGMHIAQVDFDDR